MYVSKYKNADELIIDFLEQVKTITGECKELKKIYSDKNGHNENVRLLKVSRLLSFWFDDNGRLKI